MPALSRCWAIFIANMLIPIAVLIFSSGFFPYKPLIPGLATHEQNEKLAAPPRIFDKVIFMVIDALRRYGCSSNVPVETLGAELGFQ